MNINRILQLQRRRDRLQNMLDENEGYILDLAKAQWRLERKAYFEIFPERVDVDRWEKWKGADHLNDSLHLRLGDGLGIETWWHGCRGGSDEMQGGFQLDPRMESEAGQIELYAAFLDKYRAMQGNQKQKAREDLEAKRKSLEEELRKLNGGT